MKKLTAGTILMPRTLTTMRDEPVGLFADDMTHLQFLRFAGCPICNLHLRSFVSRRDELRVAGVREVVVFHSTREELLKYEAELPFDVIPDPDKALYREFGVEASARAILNPRAWPTILRGILASLREAIRDRAPFAPLAPAGGELGLPADLLIAPDGKVVAVKYGQHAADQWSVDEVLEVSRPSPAPSLRHAPDSPGRHCSTPSRSERCARSAW